MPNVNPGAPNMYPRSPGGMPGMAPLSPISHQARGIQIGCANCPAVGPALKDVAPDQFPTWAKILGGMALLGLIVLFLNITGKK